MGKEGEIFPDTASYHAPLKWWGVFARANRIAKADFARCERASETKVRAPLKLSFPLKLSPGSLPSCNSIDLPRPHNADWAWRPDAFCGQQPDSAIPAVRNRSKIGANTTLFHDCTKPDIALRQICNPRNEGFPASGMQMDVRRFSGSFLSLVFDLPKDAISGLTRSHIIGVNTVINLDQFVNVFARLNVRHGPNTEQIVREVCQNGKDACTEFDLAYSNMNERRIEKAWFDLIIERPKSNRIIFRDVTFNRRLRATI